MGLDRHSIATLTWRHSVPFVFSVLLLCSGGMLLVSGALPAIPEHVNWLRHLIPLTLMEISHVIASLAGVFLLFLSRAVRLRLDAAYYACLIVLALGIVASLVKGFEWHQALILLVMFFMFLPTRKYFDRKASLLTMSFTPQWIALIAVIIIVSTWLGFAAYHHVAYSHELWWKFSYLDDAPRFLRAALISAIVVFAYILNNIFKVQRPKPSEKITAEELRRVRDVAGSSQDMNGFLALLGDKNLLWSERGNAFIMYVMTPRYWIAMGDPIGDPDEFAGLLWQFRENAYRHAAYAVFYQVSDKYLPLYLDRGLVLLKMGEEARIFLTDFSLEGSKRENQRKTRNRFSKNGFTFRILEPEEVAGSMQALRQISDQWLATKNAHEKGFSLGFFNEDYLRHTKIGVIEKEGRIYAFANYWTLDSRSDIAIDLMRYNPESPVNIMEYLFVESILYAQKEGYQWFGLGMSPLSGMEQHALAPLWHKIGNIIYKHGEDFYNFEGLRIYKSKFNPAWRPRYLAVPPGPRIPLVLLSISRIIAGGLTSIFRK